jgi:hypothetical protein
VEDGMPTDPRSILNQGDKSRGGSDDSGERKHGREDIMGGLIAAVRARSPLPHAIAKDFSGLWVALRDGRVIASNDDHEALLEDDAVDPLSDAIYHVPEEGSYYYF